MILKLRNLNEYLLIKYKNDEKNYEKQVLIKNILRDEKCFFKMSIEDAYMILHELGIEKNDIKAVYKELIDSKNFL